MQPIPCELCTHKISPYAKACPRCGHPAPVKKPSLPYQLIMLFPTLFFGAVFIICGLAAGFFVVGALGILNNAQTIMQEMVAIQMGICASVLILTAIVCAVAVSPKN